MIAYCVIPFMWNVQSKQTHKYRNYANGYQGLEEWENVNDC